MRSDLLVIAKYFCDSSDDEGSTGNDANKKDDAGSSSSTAKPKEKEKNDNEEVPD